MLKATPQSPSFLSRERTVAAPGFNRWLVPPAALAIHLCIGMIYGFSVFWLPLQRAVGVVAPKVCSNELSFLQWLFATDCDWENKALGWTFSLAIVFLGSSAAIFGHWLETAGPRKAGLASACCWCGGLLISALGVYSHQIYLLWLGSGVIGGIGLGLGYISPVSTLMKWFPDRRGLATGLAIMGFGGGAMIGAPLADRLMSHFATSESVGVWQTFVALAAIYFVFMVCGALGYRVPRDGWAPEGWTPPAAAADSMVTHRHVHLDGLEDAAVLAPMERADAKRERGNRSAVHFLADVAGGVRRPFAGTRHRFRWPERRPEEEDRGNRRGLHGSVEPVQYFRAPRMGERLGSTGAQADFRAFLRAGLLSLRLGAHDRP
jgi:MFS family permease